MCSALRARERFIAQCVLVRAHTHTNTLAHGKLVGRVDLLGCVFISHTRTMLVSRHIQSVRIYNMYALVLVYSERSAIQRLGTDTGGKAFVGSVRGRHHYSGASGVCRLGCDTNTEARA